MKSKRKDPDSVDVQVCSVQEGEARFPRSEEHRSHGPPVAWYRNNLTALSQKHNLLFVAYQSVVYTFRPEFPSQILPRKAILAIDLPRTAADRPGYIDPRNPHAVNHMLVGDIGHEEILVVGCDDGDVIAFTTNSIQQAIQENVAGNTDIGCRLNAFFSENVGRSAWGLAIHKAARLIAVSANTHQITVFAFALGCDLGPESGSDDEDDALSSAIDGLGSDTDWLSLEGSFDAPERSSRNIKVTLTGHETNIPAISFCNSDVDPIGQYLVSTDIDGQIFVWDIWKKKRIADMMKIWNPSSHPCVGGWGVACLDPKSLRRTDGPRAGFGREVVQSRDSSQNIVWDNSEDVDEVPDSSTYHPAMAEFGPLPGVNDRIWHNTASGEHLVTRPSQSILIWDTADEWNDTDGSEDLDDDDSDGDDIWHQESLGQQSENDEEVETNTASSGLEAPVDDQWPELDESVLETIIAGNMRRGRLNNASSIHANAEIHSDESENQSLHDATDNTFPAAQLLPSQPDLLRSHESSSLSASEKLDLPFHLLYTSKDSINICSLRIRPSASCVVCNNVLRQIFPPRLSHFTNFNRLNMIEQIPELGLIIIASQVGRAVVLTTTSPTDRVDDRMSAGLRLAHILPYKSQEAEGVRPEVPLMGIAVGPVQGHGIGIEAAGGESPVSKDSKASKLENGRYRLMMIYCDHTVLSYEIGRSTTGTGYEVNERVLHM